MGNYNRFDDDNYKNWLKVTESLHILRNCLRLFIENETETYHRSLRDAVSGSRDEHLCRAKCSWKDLGKKPVCPSCGRWRDAILQNHNAKGMGVHWNNCLPSDWPTKKWEVAKAYMPRGHSDHGRYEQFDIAALLNFITHCKHFNRFALKRCVTEVITVRNKAMHSPDLRLSEEQRSAHLGTIRNLAKKLEPHAPELRTLPEEIDKFSSILERQNGHEDEDGQGNKQLMKTLVLEREQQALKEKIESLSQCYEDCGAYHAEVEGMKTFLDQNKDLLENLGPQVALLKEVQEKVEQHDLDINDLSGRVDQLEQGVQGDDKEREDPVFSGDPMKFKNHLFETARKNKWPEPVFTEIQEANGYRGIVTVNGQSFTGLQVCNAKKNAHQEVAKRALEKLQVQLTSLDETSSQSIVELRDMSSISGTSSSGPTFYSSVTVILDSEVSSQESNCQEMEAIESAYKELFRLWGLEQCVAGSSYRTQVLDHFRQSGFQEPLEHLSPGPDNNICCKLKLTGPFTFENKGDSDLAWKIFTLNNDS